MEDRKTLKEKELAQVSGGGGVSSNSGGRKCPYCGSTETKFIGEEGDFGAFVCETCGKKFYGDI